MARSLNIPSNKKLVLREKNGKRTIEIKNKPKIKINKRRVA